MEKMKKFLVSVRCKVYCHIFIELGDEWPNLTVEKQTAAISGAETDHACNIVAVAV